MTVAEQLRTVPGRWAVTGVFFVNGLTLSTYIVRAPSLKSAYHLGDGRFGLVGLFFAVAALVGMQAVGPLTARVQTRTILRVTLAVMPLLLAGVAVAPGPWWFAAVAAVLGAFHGVTDAAMNAVAVGVERRAGRPILNGCHAAWSISAVVASLSTAALARVGVPFAAHLVVAGAVLLVAGLLLGPRLPRAGRAQAEAQGPAGADGAQRPVGAVGVQRSVGADGVRRPAGARGAGLRAGWSRALILLGVTGTAVMICEGGALGWGGVFLHDERHASLSLAAVAITAYTGGQTLGRLAGDRLTGRWGGNALFRLGATIAAAGFAAAVLLPRPGAAIAGFAVAGLGASVLLPLTYSAVGGLPGAPTATLIARLTTFTYSGVLVAPALIGWSAERVGLTATMTALVPLLLLTTLLPRPDSRAAAT